MSQNEKNTAETQAEQELRLATPELDDVGLDEVAGGRARNGGETSQKTSDVTKCCW